jgi:hypothetical protein
VQKNPKGLEYKKVGPRSVSREKIGKIDHFMMALFKLGRYSLDQLKWATRLRIFVRLGHASN